MSADTSFSQLLRKARQERGYSIRDLAARAGLDMAGVVRLEQGKVARPQVDTLTSLARALEIPLADLYSAAGYPLPSELPSLPAYLRTKYRDLPPPAQAELQAYVQLLHDKYGLTPGGPAPGEDEQDDDT